MDFLPDTATLITYSAASIALFITPGPDMSLFLTRTMASGRQAGIASVMGANLGCIVHTFLAAFGISALLAASHTGFLILKIVGATYLLWLAVDAIRHGSSLNMGNVELPLIPWLREWQIRHQGIIHQVTRPSFIGTSISMTCSNRVRGPVGQVMLGVRCTTLDRYYDNDMLSMRWRWPYAS